LLAAVKYFYQLMKSRPHHTTGLTYPHREDRMPRIAMIVGVLLLAACKPREGRFPKLEADVRHALPLGLKIDAVARGLDSMGIRHSRIKTDSLRMVALVPAVATSSYLFSYDAMFELLFDSTGRLTRINARLVSTGP
jgi:hypothetical protein